MENYLTFLDLEVLFFSYILLSLCAVYLFRLKHKKLSSKLDEIKDSLKLADAAYQVNDKLLRESSKSIIDEIEKLKKDAERIKKDNDINNESLNLEIEKNTRLEKELEFVKKEYNNSLKTNLENQTEALNREIIITDINESCHILNEHVIRFGDFCDSIVIKLKEKRVSDKTVFSVHELKSSIEKKLTSFLFNYRNTRGKKREILYSEFVDYVIEESVDYYNDGKNSAVDETIEYMKTNPFKINSRVVLLARMKKDALITSNIDMNEQIENYVNKTLNKHENTERDTNVHALLKYFYLYSNQDERNVIIEKYLKETENLSCNAFLDVLSKEHKEKRSNGLV